MSAETWGAWYAAPITNGQPLRWYVGRLRTDAPGADGYRPARPMGRLALYPTRADAETIAARLNTTTTTEEN